MLAFMYLHNQTPEKKKRNSTHRTTHFGLSKFLAIQRHADNKKKAQN